MSKDTKIRWPGLLIALGIAWITSTSTLSAEEPFVSVVTDHTLGPAASHGLEKLLAALKAKGAAFEKVPSPAKAGGKFLLAVGLASSDGFAARLLTDGNQPVPQGPEALVIRRTEWNGRPAWVTAGSDDRGLMYAELDVADRIGWSTEPGTPFSEVRDTSEFDFASDHRNEGDTPGRNDKGLVTYDRQTRKDAFYWYRANWSSAPVLYISSRRYVNRPNTTVDVKVHSNLDAAQFSVNGMTVGTRTSTDHIFLWTGVVLFPGANTLAVTATQGPTTYTDKVTWNARGR